MPRKRFKVEQIIQHLREAEVLLSQGQTLAKELSGSASQIEGGPMQPKHQIVTDKIRAVGMQFGGDELLGQTVAELVDGLPSRPSPV